MKTKKLFTSIAAAVMLSTSLAGSGAVLSLKQHMRLILLKQLLRIQMIKRVQLALSVDQ
ncbi:hypothetical protein IMAU50064_01187 [Lactobacillus helveticus]|uniref:Uncharacterized protein n=1 Tax=Lactobacillus helveticus TaxID=1587 RepID=A0A9Q5C0I3_LACHE|nr:hypothetical protein [Lactobacillus helveticus]NRN91726.1 hypothetical protein [Lactobacillus helveticus]NRN95879.1 hypothetical protein [Lactobacillus helveticus]NRO14633.1 hypothetical protein [Lactobacillus helveticus]NRO53074.1 hypothetical protein [Lactobacillus helveticus]